MIHAEYDSQADVLSIDLLAVEGWDATESIDDDYCQVAFSEGRPANIELLAPTEHVDLLKNVASRFKLDPQALEAAAKSALSAPDRAIELEVLSRVGS